MTDTEPMAYSLAQLVTRSRPPDCTIVAQLLSVRARSPRQRTTNVSVGRSSVRDIVGTYKGNTASNRQTSTPRM